MRSAVVPLLVSIVSTAALAGTYLVPTNPVVLSDLPVDLGDAAKVKLNLLGSGWLIAVFSDGVGDPVFDVKSRTDHPAGDIFARRCNERTVDCSVAANWSPPVNVSNTALLSSISTAFRGPLEGPLRFAGDSEKPNVFTKGNDVVISWIDAYCPGGEQGTVSYVELDDREMPFRCLWTARSTNGGQTWLPAQQVSDGWRDAKQDTNRGSEDAWVITWQEDPAGLKLGDAEGPGDGASGSNVSHGTDIWYTALSTADLHAGSPFPEPTRITNNYTRIERKQGTTLDVEAGVAGASRANTVIMGPTVMIAYEETKGSQGADFGKVIRYHVFPWDQAPSSCESALPQETDEDSDAVADTCVTNPRGEPQPATEDPARVGCILSDPLENARRVRFITQETPGTNTGLSMAIFWRQGLYDQGGPGDVVVRMGYRPTGDTDPAAGFRPSDMVPAVAVPTATELGDPLDGCYLIGDELLGDGAQANTPGVNLSADTETGGNLTAATDDNPNEDAKAHRGILRGDFIALGYTYTPNWAVATATDLENYEFWMRTSTNGGQTWGAPRDISSANTAAQAATLGLRPEQINVREPRIVKTPGSGPGCPTGIPTDPTTTNPTDCASGTSFLVAWGSQLNTYAHLGGNIDLDVFLTRTQDRGVHFDPVINLANTPVDEDLESQLQIRPDGRQLYAVWNQDVAGVIDALYLSVDVRDAEVCNGVDDDGDGLIDGDDPDVADGDGDGFGACEDCDDNDPLTFPGGFELTADGVDGDCDGVEVCFADVDGDGARSYTELTSPDTTCDAPGLAYASAEVDCADTYGNLSRDDEDGDGWSTCAGDCDDADPLTQACPGRPWLTGGDPLHAGSYTAWWLDDAPAGATALLVGGAPGGTRAVPGCPGARFDINASKILARGTVAPDGSLVWSVRTPATLLDRTVALQVVLPATCELSNVLVRTGE
jgi:hypothetical protein